jgi:hypothetical protein
MRASFANFVTAGLLETAIEQEDEEYEIAITMVQAPNPEVAEIRMLR